MSLLKLLYILKGGAGSGNFGHSGRPGKVGGSGPSGFVSGYFMRKPKTVNGRPEITQGIGMPINSVHKASSQAIEAQRKLADLHKKYEEEVENSQIDSEIKVLQKSLRDSLYNADLSNKDDAYFKIKQAHSEKWQEKQAMERKYKDEAYNILKVAEEERPKLEIDKLSPNVDTAGVEFFTSVCSDKTLSGKEVSIEKTSEDRSFYNPFYGLIGVSDKSPYGAKVDVAHEMGHWYEDNSQEVKSKAIDYWSKRTGFGTEHANLTSFDDAFLNEDKFPYSYMGKVYTLKNTPEIQELNFGLGGSEIISCGLESMLKNPTWFAVQDPDYFAFMYDTLRGN